MKVKKYSHNLLGELTSSVKTLEKLIYLEKDIQEVINIIVKKIKAGGKVLICGNGGSAADAQHLVAEFLVRLSPNNNRAPIPAIPLLLDSSTYTACANDYSFSKIFSRNIEALGSKKDVLIAISTSGHSKNIIEALKEAKKKKICAIGFLGADGGKAKKLCNISLVIKSSITARIQESHKFLSHFIAQQVESLLMKKKNFKKNLY